MKDQKAEGLQRPMGTGQKVQESKQKGQTSEFLGQNDVSAPQHTVYVSHSIPAKKRMPSYFMAAGKSTAILGAKMKKSVTASTFSPSVWHEGQRWTP